MQYVQFPIRKTWPAAATLTPTFPPQENFASSVRPIVFLCRFFGLAPYSIDAKGSGWSVIGVLINVVWIIVTAPVLGFAGRFISALNSDPRFCGVFGTVSSAIIMALATCCQSLLYLLLSLIFYQRQTMALAQLNEIVTADLRSIRRVVIACFASAIAILIAVIGFTAHLVYKMQIQPLIELMMAKRGTFAYQYYLVESYLAFPSISYGWMIVTLITVYYVIITFSFGRQFTHLTLKLRSAVVFGQFEMLRRRHVHLLECLSECDDILSYFALIATVSTGAMICVAVNADLILNEFTALHYADFWVTLIIQCLSFFLICVSATWLQEKASDVNLAVARLHTLPPDLDASIARWIRTASAYPDSLTVGKFFRIDRNAIMTIVSVIVSGTLLWKQLKSDEVCTTKNGTDVYIQLLKMIMDGGDMQMMASG